MTGSKNNPPCGAGHPQPSKIVMNPASALPAMQAKLTRSGSRSANGSAPSVTKVAPISRVCGAEQRSVLVNRVGNSRQASPMPSGGIMPPAMTAAIRSYCWSTSASVPLT